LRYRIAFFVTALVVLGLIVTLPFSVKTVVDDVLGPAPGRVIQLMPQSGPPAPNHVNLHLAVTSIDEVQLFATIRLSGHHVCAGCAWSHRVLLVAITSDDAEAAAGAPSRS